MHYINDFSLLFGRDSLEKVFFKTQRGVDGYEVTLDIPGVKRENLRVTMSGRDLRVETERAGEERVYRGKLPEDISSEGVAARLEDGVLTILVPFREGYGDKVIEVE